VNFIKEMTTDYIVCVNLVSEFLIEIGIKIMRKEELPLPPML